MLYNPFGVKKLCSYLILGSLKLLFRVRRPQAEACGYRLIRIGSRDSFSRSRTWADCRSRRHRSCTKAGNRTQAQAGTAWDHNHLSPYTSRGRYRAAASGSSHLGRSCTPGRGTAATTSERNHWDSTDTAGSWAARASATTRSQAPLHAPAPTDPNRRPAPEGSSRTSWDARTSRKGLADS